MSTLAKFTVAEFDHMLETGAFSDDRRIELIHGELREMSPINPPHEDTLDELVEWSFDNAPRKQVRIRVQESVGVSALDSVPQPDLAWMRRKRYRRVRPTGQDVLLLVEVADSSVDYDTGTKANLYAAARIADYWVVNIPDRCIEVFRKPTRGRYTEHTVYRPGERLHPLAFPKLAVSVSDLFDIVS